MSLLVEQGRLVACALRPPDGRPIPGWILPEHLELAAQLKRARPRTDEGVLLSPFDPLLWDRSRVKQLFGFDQVLEIFKPAAKRTYGYYCMPVLAGERLIARCDLKADRKRGRLKILSMRFEGTGSRTSDSAAEKKAVASALDRYASGVQLRLH